VFNMNTRTIDVLKGAIDKSRISSLHKNFAGSHGITSFNFDPPPHRTDTSKRSHTDDCISMCTVTLNAKTSTFLHTVLTVCRHVSMNSTSMPLELPASDREGAAPIPGYSMQGLWRITWCWQYCSFECFGFLLSVSHHQTT
jgi:hypothetical protein